MKIARGLLPGIVAVFALGGVGAADISVPAGDLKALQEAIETANGTGEMTTILITGEFAVDLPLPPIVGDIVLSQRNSQPVFRPGGAATPHQLLRVEAGGSLVMDGVRIEGFALSHIRQHDGPLIENRGRLVIRRGQFERLTGRIGGGFCCGEDQDTLIGNAGELEIERTTFLDVANEAFQGGVLVNQGGRAELREVLTASRGLASKAAIANLAGLVRITNGTFAARENALFTAEGAITELANTILTVPSGRAPQSIPDGFVVSGLRACTGPVVSLGHNLVVDQTCALDGPGDRQGVPTGTFPLSLENTFNGPQPVIGLAGASPAVDSADPDYCGRFDIRGNARIIDGDNDGIRACDRGAVELSQRRLTDGGINGLYHVPDHDGHYITMLDNASNLLVIWNTFDREGNQAWLFATGELVNGRSLVATAYTNENGVLTDLGPIDTELAVPWGTLTVELESCDQGRMLFATERDDFVSGEVRFRRLAASRHLGCSE